MTEAQIAAIDHFFPNFPLVGTSDFVIVSSDGIGFATRLSWLSAHSQFFAEIEDRIAEQTKPPELDGEALKVYEGKRTVVTSENEEFLDAACSFVCPTKSKDFKLIGRSTAFLCELMGAAHKLRMPVLMMLIEMELKIRILAHSFSFEDCLQTFGTAFKFGFSELVKIAVEEANFTATSASNGYIDMIEKASFPKGYHIDEQAVIKLLLHFEVLCTYHLTKAVGSMTTTDQNNQSSDTLPKLPPTPIKRPVGKVKKNISKTNSTEISNQPAKIVPQECCGYYEKWWMRFISHVSNSVTPSMDFAEILDESSLEFQPMSCADEDYSSSLSKKCWDKYVATRSFLIKATREAPKFDLIM